MAEIFSGYLKIGFWTAFVIGGALLLLPRLSRRYTAKLPYAVWLVLTLRLLCPVGLSIPEAAGNAGHWRAMDGWLWDS